MKILSTLAFVALVTGASPSVGWAADCDVLKGNSYLYFTMGTFNGVAGTAAAGQLIFDATGKGHGQYIEPSPKATTTPPRMIALLSVTCANGTLTYKSEGGDAGTSTMKPAAGGAIHVTYKGGASDMSGWFLPLKK